MSVPETTEALLDSLDSVKADIKSSIETKLGVADIGSDFTTYASEIDSIPTGGSSTIVQKEITVNGTYNAISDSADGYNPVIVNVPDTPYYFTSSAAVYFENHVVPNKSSISGFLAINGASHMKSYKSYAPNAHSTAIYQVWDASNIEEIECPYITSIGYVSFSISNRSDKECIRTFGSIGYPVTSIDSRAFAFNENKGTGWTCVLYVNAQTLADIPSAVKDTSPWGANFLSNIIYKNSTTGEVITA